jgi:hypothetical protein
MIRWKVKDFRRLERLLKVGFTKTGKDRFAPLVDEALVLLLTITEGRDPDEPLFLRANGKPWNRSDQQLPMEAATAAAGLDLTFYGLRHTAISIWLLHGIEPALIAEATGTSISMIQHHYANMKATWLGSKMNAKAPRIGLSEEVMRPLLKQLEAEAAQRCVGTLELDFDLASLHPKTYLGKTHGGTRDRLPPPPRPTKEELEALLLEMPVTHIGQKYGVTDQAVAKWCRKFGLAKPGRGEWGKIKAGKNDEGPF